MATLTVQCSDCKVQFDSPAQSIKGTDRISVTFKARRHKRACKNSATHLQPQLKLAQLQGGGWKTCCRGKLKIAWRSPTPQKQRLITSMLG